ncbi:hypothetical protein Calag_1338 [Caldisphaera lagunensis DSM 15908]|uniref:Uncharacterized protein n=1 Tax=Caldisphaera lagunensis (strain DSM 15908 / JCM 11604 / ANMR 0165 / IC-154) TaxID=1056495 RepID=L0AD30_CALLD|nr:hypothetical protein [Caldisphaera lagunensis]AFZ71047.1 hypothetical protein Calag_1338 [Caldisphaera lagunensis DSM 15908]
MSKESIEKIVFPEIHAVTYKPKSECEFFSVIEKEGSYYAKCKFLDSMITKSKISKCEKDYKTCPYRKLGLKTLENQ